jgi:hypothetical protein
LRAGSVVTRLNDSEGGPEMKNQFARIVLIESGLSSAQYRF